MSSVILGRVMVWGGLAAILGGIFILTESPGVTLVAGGGMALVVGLGVILANIS